MSKKYECVPVSFIDYCHDRRACYVGNRASCDAWHDRKCVHMAGVYGRCIFECSGASSNIALWRVKSNHQLNWWLVARNMYAKMIFIFSI